MPVSILLKAVDNILPDPIRNRRSPFKGDIWEIRPSGHYTEWETMGNLCVLNISDATPEQVEQYKTAWYFTPVFTQTDRIIDPGVSETRKVTMSAAETSLREYGVSYGRMIKSYLTTYLDRWDITYETDTTNSINISFDVWDIFKSQGMVDSFRHDVTGITAVKNSYGSDEYDTTIDYSAVPDLSSKKVENKLERMGASIVSHSSNVIRITIGAQDIVKHAKKAFIDALEDMPLTRYQLFWSKYRLPNAVMNTIIDAGGEYTATKAELLGYIQNKLTLT